jgi:hypothetical protein
MLKNIKEQPKFKPNQEIYAIIRGLIGPVNIPPDWVVHPDTLPPYISPGFLFSFRSSVLTIKNLTQFFS